jgi:hypothetical protein
VIAPKAMFCRSRPHVHSPSGRVVLRLRDDLGQEPALPVAADRAVVALRTGILPWQAGMGHPYSARPDPILAPRDAVRCDVTCASDSSFMQSASLWLGASTNRRPFPLL